VAEGAREFGPPSDETPKQDTAGLGPEGETIDRPGPAAAVEIPAEQAESEESGE
jgi:hypothetical protein